MQPPAEPRHDPLAEVVELLRPRAAFSKGIAGAGLWSVRYDAFGHPGFCALIEGTCRLAVEGEPPVLLEAGDFVLLPATPAFVMSSLEPGPPQPFCPADAPATGIRHGRRDGPPDMRMLGGYFAFGAPDAALLVSLLPRMIHVRGNPRLTGLVRLLGEEAARDEPGRDLILARLVEILLIETLRAVPAEGAGQGLLAGLADPRLAAALRRMHGETARAWTIAELAREAGMSRSTFFERFTRIVGVRPMEYLLAWRMALAKGLLRQGGLALDEIAARVGYGSASAFAAAFARHVGTPPARFRRNGATEAAPSLLRVS